MKSNFHAFDSLSLCEYFTQVFDVVDGIRGEIYDCFLQAFELGYSPEDEVDLGFSRLLFSKLRQTI